MHIPIHDAAKKGRRAKVWVAETQLELEPNRVHPRPGLFVSSPLAEAPQGHLADQDRSWAIFILAASATFFAPGLPVTLFVSAAFFLLTSSGWPRVLVASVSSSRY